MLLGNSGLLDLFDASLFHDKFLTSMVVFNINVFVFKITMYCVKCKRKTETRDIRNVVTKNNRPMLQGVCGTTKTQFVKGNPSSGGDLVSSLNSITSNIKLPWAKFPGEMHLPGHSFTGPGTRL